MFDRLIDLGHNDGVEVVFVGRAELAGLQVEPVDVEEAQGGVEGEAAAEHVAFQHRRSQNMRLTFRTLLTTVKIRNKEMHRSLNLNDQLFSRFFVLDYEVVGEGWLDHFLSYCVLIILSLGEAGEDYILYVVVE